MRTWQLAVLLALGALLVLASLALRVRSQGKYEIKSIDLAFLVVPLLLVGLATGKVKGLDAFGVKADLSELWSQAARGQIQPQVARSQPVSVQDVVQASEMAMKGGVGELQRLVERKVDALAFQLGSAGYYGPAIRAYLEKLAGSSHLRAIVVQERDGTLFGMYLASDLIGYLNVAGDAGYAELQRLLNSGDDAARKRLASLPGFVAAKDAVTASTSKRDALAAMARLDVSSLPVIDSERRFAGTVDRSKLTSSLIVAVSDKLDAREPGPR